VQATPDLAVLLDRPISSKVGSTADRTALIFGDWNTGKTFVGLSISECTSRQECPWLGHRVKQAGVLYVTYEGDANCQSGVRCAEDAISKS